MKVFERSAAMTAWFDQYAKDHTHVLTHRTHALCIPLIVFTAMGFLHQLPGRYPVFGVPMGWAELLLSLVVFFYAQHDLKLALVAGPLGALMCVGARYLSWPVHLALAVPAWILQLAGHAIWEKNRPSFATNLVQLLVGPAYFLDGLFRKV